MMLAYKLVRLIENNSDALAAGLLAKVQSSEMTRSYRNVPAADLKDRVFDIYNHLGEWLLGKGSFDIEQRYEEIGTRRVHQGVPISEFQDFQGSKAREDERRALPRTGLAGTPQ